MPIITWDDAIIGIYFIYGLAFYSLGLALFVESGRSSELGLARSMRLLAAFGLLHGIHEWIDMVERTCECYLDIILPDFILWMRLVLLVTSFIALAAFGEHLLFREGVLKFRLWIITFSLFVFYAFSGVAAQLVYQVDNTNWRMALDVLARYTLGMPGALLACIALWHERKILLERKLSRFVYGLTWAVVALFFYGIVGQSFPAPSVVFPSNIINSNLFLEWMGFPVQLLRAIFAIVVAVSMIRVLRVLEVENQQRILAIENAKYKAEREQAEELAHLNDELRIANAETVRLLAEVQRRDALRGKLIQRITAAQETERQRIARELHDDTGQVLTGLTLALRGLSTSISLQPQKAESRLNELEGMATDALDNLRHLINDLRPPQLDDMGLVAALRFMRGRMQEARGRDVAIEFTVQGTAHPLPPEIEISLFRIAQEGVTNALKHARAKTITIELDYHDCPTLIIRDDGCGFDPQRTFETNGRTAWGLYGIQERTHLIDADLIIDSHPGEGTVLYIQLRESYCEEL
jgi:signal transduction histidine kinase